MSENSNKPCIVTDSDGPLVLCFDAEFPRGGVLLHGDDVTVFANRRQARRAMERSAAYADRRGFSWSVNARQYENRIMNVRPPLPE